MTRDFLYFCQKSKISNVYTMKKMLRTLLTVLFTVGMGYFISAAMFTGGDVKIVTENLEKAITDASNQNHNVILVITDENQTGQEASLTLASETAAMTTNTLVALVNKDNPEHQALLQKFNLTRYPAPYLIVLSPDGFVTGGVVPGKMESARLVAFVPSPKYNQALKARKEKKPAFVFIYEIQDANYNEWMNRLNESTSKLNPVAAVIPVSKTDIIEKSFIERLGIQPVSGENTVVVLNAAGQVTGKFNSLPDINALNAAASKQSTKGCGSACPSSKSCGGKTSCSEKK